MNISFDQFTYEDLPDEIVHLIGTKVHRKDLFNFKLTSKRINQNVDYSCLSNSDFRNFSRIFEVKLQNLKNVKIEKDSIKLFTNYKVRYQIARNIQLDKGPIKSITNNIIGDGFVEFFFPSSLINSDLFRVIKVYSDNNKIIVFYYLNNIYFNVFNNKEKTLLISCYSFKNYINGIYVDIIDNKPNFEILTSDKFYITNFDKFDHHSIEIYNIIANKYNVIYVELFSTVYVKNMLIYIGINTIFKIYSKFEHEFLIHYKNKFTEQELQYFIEFKNKRRVLHNRDYFRIYKICDEIENGHLKNIL
jgi:hypothetical protein